MGFCVTQLCNVIFWCLETKARTRRVQPQGQLLFSHVTGMVVTLDSRHVLEDRNIRREGERDTEQHQDWMGRAVF